MAAPGVGRRPAGPAPAHAARREAVPLALGCRQLRSSDSRSARAARHGQTAARPADSQPVGDGVGQLVALMDSRAATGLGSRDE